MGLATFDDTEPILITNLSLVLLQEARLLRRYRRSSEVPNGAPTSDISR